MDNEKEQYHDKQKLREIIDNCFSNGELKKLCFELDIPYENLSGKTKEEKVIELINYCDRRGKLVELFKIIKKERPHRFKGVAFYISKGKRLFLSITTPKMIISLAIDISGLDNKAEELFVKGIICQLCSMSEAPPKSITVFDAKKGDGKLHLTLQAPREIAIRLTEILTKKNDPYVQNELPGIEIISSEVTNQQIYTEASTSLFAKHFIQVYDPSFNYESYEKEFSDAPSQLVDTSSQSSKREGSHHEVQTTPLSVPLFSHPPKVVHLPASFTPEEVIPVVKEVIQAQYEKSLSPVPLT